jgi:hypothetical protein
MTIDHLLDLLNLTLRSGRVFKTIEGNTERKGMGCLHVLLLNCHRRTPIPVAVVERHGHFFDLTEK